MVHGVAQAARKKIPEIQQLAEAISSMARNSKIQPEVRELARVLQRILAGDKNPDLSNLPEELVTLVKEELDKQHSL